MVQSCTGVSSRGLSFLRGGDGAIVHWSLKSGAQDSATQRWPNFARARDRCSMSGDLSFCRGLRIQRRSDGPISPARESSSKIQSPSSEDHLTRLQTPWFNSYVWPPEVQITLKESGSILFEKNDKRRRLALTACCFVRAGSAGAICIGGRPTFPFMVRRTELPKSTGLLRTFSLLLRVAPIVYMRP
jgi:hypothetical protein